jgi:hypothetical protein
LNRFLQVVPEAFRKLYGQGYREVVTASSLDGARGVIKRRQQER